jgi:CspA family cold shock protein
MTGTIKSINAEKGYGFILGEDGKEYFFHCSALRNCQLGGLEKGRDVTFEDAEGSKGPRAEDVYV